MYLGFNHDPFLLSGQGNIQDMKLALPWLAQEAQEGTGKCMKDKHHTHNKLSGCIYQFW